MKMADQKIFVGIRDNLEWRHQLKSSVNEKYFKMIKVKACVQLKRTLDGRSVMIYKLDQVSTTFSPSFYTKEII